MIVIRQKEFARADYAGLTPENAAKLREQRAKLAKQLKSQFLTNDLVFGPMSSDPGNPRKLRIANANSIVETHKKAKAAREALLKSQQSKPSETLWREAAKSNLANRQNPKAAKSGVLSFIKANPKTSAAIAGTTALIGSGVMAYNHYKNKDKK